MLFPILKKKAYTLLLIMKKNKYRLPKKVYKNNYSNFYDFLLFCFLFLRTSLILNFKYHNRKLKALKRLKKIRKNKIEFKLNRLKKTYCFLQVDLFDRVIILPRSKTYFILYPKILLNFFYKIPPLNLPVITKPKNISLRRSLFLKSNRWDFVKMNNFLVSSVISFLWNSFFLRKKSLLLGLKPFFKLSNRKFKRSKKDKAIEWKKKIKDFLISQDVHNRRTLYYLHSFKKINHAFRSLALKLSAESKIVPLFRSFYLNQRVRKKLLKKHFSLPKVKKRRKSRRVKATLRRTRKSKYKKFRFNINKIVYLKTPKAVKLCVNKLITTTKINYIIRNTSSSNYSDFYKLFFTLHGHLLKHGATLKIPTLTPTSLLTVLNESLLFKNFLRRMLFLIFKRKKNNYYFTVINYFGEVLVSRSCGAIVKRLLQKRNKKIRTAAYYFYSVIKSLSNNLKRKRRFIIHYFLKNSNLNIYNVKKIIRMFRSNRIRILKIKYTPNFSHGLPTKKKKVRRL